MLATSIPSFHFSNVAPPKTHMDNEYQIEAETGEEETKKGIQIIQKTHFSDFIDYFTRRTPISSTFSDFVFYVFLLQEIIIGLMPNFTRYWGADQSTERLVRFFGYIFLVLSPPKDTVIYTIFFLFVVVFSITSIVLLTISKCNYLKHRTVPYKLCLITRYSILFTTTILLPVHVAFYGEFFNHIFDIEEHRSLKSVSPIEFIAVLIFLIFLIFLFIYSLRLLLYMHYSISFDTILFKVWRPWAIIRHYSAMCINVLMYHILPKRVYSSDTLNIPYIPIIMLIISILNSIIEMFEANWVRNSQQVKILSALISNIISSANMLIDLFIFEKNGKTHPQEVLWITMIISIIGIFIAIFLNRMSTKISMRRLNNPFYPYYLPSSDKRKHAHNRIKKSLGGSSDESFVSISSDDGYESDYYQEGNSNRDLNKNNLENDQQPNQNSTEEEIDYSSLKSIRFSSTVYKDLCIGYMNNHVDVINMKHVKRILHRFPDDININFFFAKQFFVFSSKIPIPFETLMKHFQSNSFFSPINSQIKLSISRSLGPITENSMNKMIEAREKLNRSFFKLINSIHVVYDLILYELTRSIPRAVLHFQHRYDKTLKLLFNFVQSYPESDDATFFVKLYETFFPAAVERKELKYWLNKTPNYSMIDLSLFPSHISLMMNHPDWFTSYARKYSLPGHGEKRRNRVVPELFTFDSFHIKNRKQLDDVKGPYKYAIMKPLLLFCLFLSICFPLAMMSMIMVDDFNYLKRSDTIIKCYSFMWKLDMMNSHLYPAIFFKDSTAFWGNMSNSTLIPDFDIYHSLNPSLNSLYDYKIEQLKFISDVQSELLNFAKGFGPADETAMFNETSGLFQSIDVELNENRTIYQSILYISYLAQNLLTTDKILYNQSDVIEIDVLQRLWTTSKSLHRVYLDKLDDIQLFDKSYFRNYQAKIHINTSYFLILEYLLLIGGCIYLFLSIRFTVSRYELFFMTLRETSKPAVNIMLSACQRYQRLLSHSHPHKNKKLTNISPFKFYLHFALPTILIYLLMFVIIALFTLVANCFEYQVLDNVDTYEKLTQSYHNVSKLIVNIYLLQYLYNGVESNETEILINEINEIDSYYQGVSWLFETQFPFYCKLCSLVDMMMYIAPEIGNKTYFSAIFEWLGMSQFYVSKSLFDDGVAINLIYNFIGEVDIILTKTFDLAYSTIRKTIVDTGDLMIFLTVLYILVIIVLMICVYFIIKKADSPFNNILKLLGRLPENALSKDTSKILSHHTWDFTLKQFQFDPLYYEQVLKMLPDAVIVIDRLMHIAYFNTAARKFINIQCDDEGFLTKHYKLFEVMAVDLFLYDEDPPSSNSSVRFKTPPTSSRSESSNSTSENSEAVPLCDIVEGYLLDESCSILSQRVCTGRTAQRKHYYSLTIKPIDDDENNESKSNNFFNQKNDFSHFALILKDIGEEIRQQKMLEQEAEKLNQIVYQILPKQVANQLMHDENVISMSVRNVAISYCDIVSFTPWCGSQSPQVVVKTLNSMFKIFDQMVSKYDQVTKIKCIGDCYVSAAGIFNSSITASDNLPVDSQNNILIRNPGILPTPRINAENSTIPLIEKIESNKSIPHLFNPSIPNSITPSKTQAQFHSNQHSPVSNRSEFALDFSRRTQSKQIFDRIPFESQVIPQTASAIKLSINEPSNQLPPVEDESKPTAAKQLKTKFKQDLKIDLNSIHPTFDENPNMNSRMNNNNNSSTLYPTPPTQQEIIAAKQMLSFCLDMLDGIKIVNKKLGMNLQVRVGAAFGGPISAGVIGMRMPVFDIWGELVNEANTMEASGKAMMVHIKENYYKLVCDEEYNFQPMTEEGNEGTYLVTRIEKPST